MTQKFGAQKHTGKKLDVLDHWHGFFLAGGTAAVEAIWSAIAKRHFE